jgi:hypothetical protein
MKVDSQRERSWFHGSSMRVFIQSELVVCRDARGGIDACVMGLFQLAPLEFVHCVEPSKMIGTT